jgi:saccharopine dehydrogenase (NAD+, L-lysine-forming)
MKSRVSPRIAAAYVEKLRALHPIDVGGVLSGTKKSASLTHASQQRRPDKTKPTKEIITSWYHSILYILLYIHWNHNHGHNPTSSRWDQSARTPVCSYVSPSVEVPLANSPRVTPTTTKALIEAGYKVNVERSPLRIFDDSEFSDVGATLVPEGSWVDAPQSHIIIGLKELPEDKFALKHTHVQFAHCYKTQGGWEEVLSRFPQGGGTLLDLEFLQDDTGRRVAAFGYHAGYAGAALAVEAWAHQLQHPDSPSLPGVKSYANQDLLVADVKAKLSAASAIAHKLPTVLIIGALGRCGRGAVDLCTQIGLPDSNIIKWDLPETQQYGPGPFPQIVSSDIFVNCIYLSDPIPPFLNATSLSHQDRNLSVVCDVSCDTTNPHNPIPIYTENSTFDNPTLPVPGYTNPPLSVISIDHLPSLLPREASEAFSQALLPSLLQLKNRKESPVWQQAEKLFGEKVLTLPEEMRRMAVSATVKVADTVSAAAEMVGLDGNVKK